ncbi:MAG: glycine cleavage system protein H [Gemmatimonadaceae bacterium 4484_173]|nr:MAG: glycine cleavage system protein H [Gemmatimonadaceae bacterium 4484_173]RKZ05070.1 MAG: glycine cleavage system protein GcvH [Candidatus Fermentibacteria bacterium]
MSSIPENVRYTETHEWVRKDGDRYLVGLTDHAQHEMGEIVMAELPEVGAEATKGDAMGGLEAVKTAEDFFSPLDGEVVAVNEELEANPSLINEEPFEGGWLFAVKASDDSQYDGLLTAEEYKIHIGE